MTFWTIRYRGEQIVAPVPPSRVAGSCVVFSIGVVVDLDERTVFPVHREVAILGRTDARRVDDTFRSSDARPVLDIVEYANGSVRYSWHGGNVTMSPGGSFSVNVSPGGHTQVGRGNVQINRFVPGDSRAPRGWQEGNGNTQINHF